VDRGHPWSGRDVKLVNARQWRDPDTMQVALHHGKRTGASRPKPYAQCAGMNITSAAVTVHAPDHTGDHLPFGGFRFRMERWWRPWPRGIDQTD